MYHEAAPPRNTVAMFAGVAAALLVVVALMDSNPPAAKPRSSTPKRATSWLHERDPTEAPTSSPTTSRPTTVAPTVAPTLHRTSKEMSTAVATCHEAPGTLSEGGVYLHYETLKAQGYESAFHETAKESSVYCWCDKKKGFTHCEGPQCVYDVNWGSAAHQQNHTGFPFSCKHCRCGHIRFQAAESKKDRIKKAEAWCAAHPSKDLIQNPSFLDLETMKPGDAESPNSTPFCQCKRGVTSTGAGSIRNFEYGSWPVMKNWHLFPVGCDNCSCQRE